MTVDLELLASIASGGLGQWVEGPNGQALYAKSDDCIGCLKDLQRFFRYDDPEERPAFFAVHKFNLARSDLVPLIVTYPEEYDIVYNALKVCTFMTMPSNIETGTNMRQQAEHIQRVREAFLAQDALAVIVGLLADPLARHPRMREEDIVMVQLVITFLRNLAALPTPPPMASGAASSQADAHRRIKRGLLERLFADNVMDLLLLFAQHAREQPFRSEAPVLVETLLHLLRDLEPQELLEAEAALKAEQEQQAQQAQRAAQAARQRARSKPGPVVGLALPKLPARPGQAGLVHLPKALVGNRAVAQNAPPRHPRSDATFVRRHADHNKSVVLRHNPAKTELPELSAVTDRKLAQAEKREGAGAKGQPRLGAALLMRMRQFLESFLEAGYGILMGQMFKEVQPGLNVSRLEEPDFLNFVELATLATRYVRVKEERKLLERQRQQKEGAGEQRPLQQEKKNGEEDATSPFAPISATMGWDAFYWCLKLWLTLKDGAKSKERPKVEWDLQHASVPLLKEMLLTLDLARLVGNASDRRAADRLQRRLMHDDLKESGLLPVLAQLIKGYNFRFQPRSHAVDLVEALHVVLGILDRLNASETGGFRVRREVRRKPTHRIRTPHAAPQIRDGEEEAGERERGQAGAAGGDAQGQRQEEEGAGEGESQRPATAGEGGAAGGQQPSGSVGGQVPERGCQREGEVPPGGGPPQQEEGSGEVGSPAPRPACRSGAAPAGSPAAPMEQDRVPSEGGADKEAAAAATPAAVRPSCSSGGAEAAGAAAAPAAAPAAATPGDDCISVAGTPAGALRGGGANSPPAPVTGGGRAGGALEEEEEEDEEECRPKFQEVSFDMQARVRQECAYPAVVHFYSWLLQGYRTNSPFTNRALVAFLERIADPKGLDLEPMLYQLSVLRVFHAILSDAPIYRQPEFSGLVRFCTRVVRNMFARLVPDLSEVRGRLREAEAALARAKAEGEGEGDSGHMSMQEAEEAKKRAELEIQLREACASLGFVELLFWKGANVAGDVREEYNWKKIVDPPAPRRRGRRRAGDGDGGSSSDDEPGLIGFGGAARSRKPTFDEERAEQLRREFEKCNGRKDCLDALVHEFGGMFKKVHISRQLKAMGLARGKFTAGQEERLRELYAENSDAIDCFDLLAEELAAGFSAKQVKRQLRKMGVIPAPGGKKRAKPSGKQGTAWDALGDEEGSDGEARPAGSGGMSPELEGAGGGSGSSDASSDSDDGFASAKSDLEDSDSEDEGGNAGGAGLQQLSKALARAEGKNRGGLKKARREPALGTLPFGSWDNGDDEDLALGAGGKPGKAQHAQQGASALEASDDDNDGNDVAMGSPELGPWGKGDDAALEAAATDAKAARTQQPKGGRLRKAGAVGKRPAAAPPAPAALEDGNDGDGQAEGLGQRAGAAAQPAAKRSKAKAPLGAESSDDEGGSFVTMEDREGGAGAAGEVEQEEADSAAQQQQPAKQAKGKAGAKKGATASKQQQGLKKRASPAFATDREGKQQQQQQMRKKRAKAGPSPQQRPPSDSESENGFLSAGESDPGSEASLPPKQAAREPTAAKRTAGKAAAAAKRRREPPAESDYSDDDAPLWTSGKSKAQKHSPAAGAAQALSPASAPQSPAEAAARPKKKKAAAAEAGQRPAGGPGGARKEKRKASAEEAGGATAQRAAALEQLRRRRLGTAAGAREGPAGAATAAVAALPPATEPFGEWRDFTERGDVENEVPADQQAPKPGRRLLKKAGGSTAGTAQAQAPMLEDLEDF